MGPGGVGRVEGGSAMSASLGWGGLPNELWRVGSDLCGEMMRRGVNAMDFDACMHACIYMNE